MDDKTYEIIAQVGIVLVMILVILIPTFCFRVDEKKFEEVQRAYFDQIMKQAEEKDGKEKQE